MAFKELQFGEGFVEALESGWKQITIRRGQRDFSPGELVEAVCAEGDRFILEITSCNTYLTIDVPEEDLCDDGFSDVKDLVFGLRRFDPDMAFAEKVTSIRFQVLARKGGKVFIICPVRDADSDVTKEISNYVARLEEAGCRVHWPPRDTDQNDHNGIRICGDNCDAIIDANEVHIWFDPNSKGSLFDRGMTVALRSFVGLKKRVVWINETPPALDQGKFEDFLTELTGDEDTVRLWFDSTDPVFLFEGGMLFALLRLGFKKKVVLLNDGDVKKTDKKSFANVFRALAEGFDIARKDAADILAALAEE